MAGVNAKRLQVCCRRVAATPGASAPVTVTLGTWYTLSLQVSGTTLRGTVDGGTPLQATDSQYAAGGIGVATFNAAADFDDVLVDSGTGPTPPVTSTTTNPPTTPPVTTTTTTTNPPTTTTTVPPMPNVANGFAAVNALGQNGTTGGAGGPTVTVTTTEQFLDSIARPGPYVIRVQGTITLPTGTSDGMHNVSSAKDRIIGAGAAPCCPAAGTQPACRAVTRPTRKSPRRRVTEGGVQVHVRLSASGGRRGTVVHAHRRHCEDGTSMALSGCEDSPHHVAGWPQRLAPTRPGHRRSIRTSRLRGVSSDGSRNDYAPGLPPREARIRRRASSPGPEVPSCWPIQPTETRGDRSAHWEGWSGWVAKS